MMTIQCLFLQHYVSRIHKLLQHSPKTLRVREYFKGHWLRDIIIAHHSVYQIGLSTTLVCIKNAKVKLGSWDVDKTGLRGTGRLKQCVRKYAYEKYYYARKGILHAVTVLLTKFVPEISPHQRRCGISSGVNLVTWSVPSSALAFILSTIQNLWI